MRNIPILMYHQVDAAPAKGSAMRGLVVTPERFAWHMRTLALLGYTGLSMRELEPYWSGAKSGKVVGITFDDGYKNNVDIALPILQRFGFSATCYVVTQAMGQFNSWDASTGVPQKPLMTIDDGKKWLQAGQELGTHTCTHADLSQLDEHAQVREIQEAKAQLDTLFGTGTARHFCYPYGRFNAQSLHIARSSGYITATTTERGRALATDDAMRLPRVLVSRTTSSLMLAVKLLTRYEDKRRLKGKASTHAAGA